VKGGLDFALLEKARQQAERIPQVRDEEEEDQKNLSIEEVLHSIYQSMLMIPSYQTLTVGPHLSLYE